MPVSASAFRAALAKRAAGVAIVTARCGAEVQGMTVTDYAGASLAPPLLLLCAAKTANTLGAITRGRNFCLNLLAENQRALASKFADKAQETRRFDGLDCAAAVTGAPLIPGALAALDCSLAAAHDAGDHTILIGQVEAVSLSAADAGGAPLLYYAAGFRRLQNGAA